MTTANVPPVFVNPRPHDDRLSGRFSSWGRGLLIVGGLTLVALLAIAGGLTPNERGFGTHEQLPWTSPCGFRQWTGLACPTCGMTTSWAWIARGNLGMAWHSNPFGCVLGLTSFLLGPWAIASGVRGRWLGIAPTARFSLGILVGIGALGLLQWLARIAGAL